MGLPTKESSFKNLLVMFVMLFAKVRPWAPFQALYQVICSGLPQLRGPGPQPLGDFGERLS